MDINRLTNLAFQDRKQKQIELKKLRQNTQQISDKSTSYSNNDNENIIKNNLHKVPVPKVLGKQDQFVIELFQLVKEFSKQANNKHDKNSQNIKNQSNQEHDSLNSNSYLNDHSEELQDPEIRIIEFFCQNYTPLSSNLTRQQIEDNENFRLSIKKDQVYFGEMDSKQEKKEGFGILVYKNTRIYEGYWKNDMRSGKSIEIQPDGGRYEGLYDQNLKNGKGQFKWVNGEIYDGQWKNGLKHGSGLWKGQKGDSYIGEWKLGKADGFGVHTWVNGDTYEGEFKECLKHGRGNEKFSNGDSYIGNYQHGKPEGYGEYQWVNGNFYKGYFINGLRHGRGIWYSKKDNGDVYEGEYKNDKKSGYGKYMWANGNIFIGSFENDLRHGQGEMSYQDGKNIQGYWVNGIHVGQSDIKNVDLIRNTQRKINEEAFRQGQQKQNFQQDSNSYQAQNIIAYSEASNSQPGTPIKKTPKTTRKYINQSLIQSQQIKQFNKVQFQDKFRNSDEISHHRGYDNTARNHFIIQQQINEKLDNESDVMTNKSSLKQQIYLPAIQQKPYQIEYQQIQTEKAQNGRKIDFNKFRIQDNQFNMKTDTNQDHDQFLNNDQNQICKSCRSNQFKDSINQPYNNQNINGANEFYKQKVRYFSQNDKQSSYQPPNMNNIHLTNNKNKQYLAETQENNDYNLPMNLQQKLQQEIPHNQRYNSYDQNGQDFGGLTERDIHLKRNDQYELKNVQLLKSSEIQIPPKFDYSQIGAQSLSQRPTKTKRSKTQKNKSMDRRKKNNFSGIFLF